MADLKLVIGKEVLWAFEAHEERQLQTSCDQKESIELQTDPMYLNSMVCLYFFHVFFVIILLNSNLFKLAT